MFLVIDSSPAAQIEPCNACKTLMEVGPPPMADSGSDDFELVITPLMPCRHNQTPLAWERNFENCA